MEGKYLLFTVITLNGKGFSFFADDVEENEDWYEFMLEGEIVAKFLIKGVCGYFKRECKDEEDI